ncbi:MAG: T9SS type A sorting domain-containing protein [Flavobacteriales bacterium]|nr:T9SS type A sorting domain-containing protein [Flavobacteriales bacterium]
MKMRIAFISLLIFPVCLAFSQSYPTFGEEKSVTITGLTFDAMEPFISVDEQFLFFNSLNAGGNTNLYYATRTDDTTFTYVGLVNGTYDPSVNHLDAVASMDSANRFYWTSLRSIPNLYKGQYLNGSVGDISKIYGTCNIETPGWIIMDACIHYSGQLLYYSNSYFGPTFTECVGVPCESRLGVAQMVNDSTFDKTIYSEDVLANINDPDYLIYAPQITKDELELYFTRLLIGGFDTEICVSVRNSATDAFDEPTVIYSNFGYFPEAASPTTDKQKIYYHKKNEDGLYQIYMRYRLSPNTIQEGNTSFVQRIYPNPSDYWLNIDTTQPAELFTVDVISTLGEVIIQTSNTSRIDISDLPQGMYFLSIKQGDSTYSVKFMKE